MRFATIRTPTGTSAARVDGDELVVLPFDDVGALVKSRSDWSDVAAEYEGESFPVADAQWATLISQPEKIFCIGLNYHEHAAEAGLDVPDYPVVFSKYERSLIGAGDRLILPANSDQVDWEVELGVVIGSTLRHADLDAARDGIAGYTIVNDISMRDWQMRTSQMLQGKTFEDSTPVGPYLVTPDEVGHDTRLRMTCHVDDEVMQDAYTDGMIFSPIEIVSYLSQFITLVPGDLIATGTPSGVGVARTPPIFLKDGQTIRLSIDGLGEQINLCSSEGELR